MDDLDLTPVWKELASSNVLLLVDTHFIPDPMSDEYINYDREFFRAKLESVHSWFLPIIEENLSELDYRMKNNAILSVRPLRSEEHTSELQSH